jgi:starch synthase (maltosyl-transferring)
MPLPSNGQSRVVIERVRPQIDGGQFRIKRTAGQMLVVEADIFCDGHDHIAAVLQYAKVGSPPDTATNQDLPWTEVPMTLLVNDVWQSEFTTDQIGTYRYTVTAWIDRFGTWRHDLQKRLKGAVVTPIDMAIGADLIAAASRNARGDDRATLDRWFRLLQADDVMRVAEQVCVDAELELLMHRHSGRLYATTYDRVLEVTVDPQRAGFSAWYEMFPRSAAEEPGRHGTLQDVIARLPYVASMGFDVLYLPPIHPVGVAFRKGKNNATVAAADDVGSPWAIGAKAGGHKAINPTLGTLADFQSLVSAARHLGIELALDIAFQCSPDHPYVAAHPQWFRQRPDGTIQYAENPPKKYQDIYPFDFETDDWRALWAELKSIFDYWIDQGVTIFRVDNPHTKPFPFWEWCIGEIHQRRPDVQFLAEAFTRPKIMYRLAKLGFTQSYTYFAWRNGKDELREYLEELTQTEAREFFRPNFWPNTPDILPEYLQTGGRAAFIARLVLAATLSPNYGIYGPPFEHGWSAPRNPGSEEYLHSEKYQLHHHDLKRQDSLKPLISQVNGIRHQYPVLQRDDTLQFHDVSNDRMICYSRSAVDAPDILVVVVNLDPDHKQSGFVELPLTDWGLDAHATYDVHDLLTDSRYVWRGPRNYVELHPQLLPAHVLRIRRSV